IIGIPLKGSTLLFDQDRFESCAVAATLIKTEEEDHYDFEYHTNSVNSFKPIMYLNRTISVHNGTLDCQGLCQLTVLSSVRGKDNYFWKATLFFGTPKEEDPVTRANLTQCFDTSTVCWVGSGCIDEEDQDDTGEHFGMARIAALEKILWARDSNLKEDI
ncbi:hypothetical protein PFISCL1PPCAC_22082, partial [Pristionchus fissidentatus]